MSPAVRDRLERATGATPGDDAAMLRALLSVLERHPVVLSYVEVAALGERYACGTCLERRARR